MSDINLSNDVLKNILSLVTQGVAKDKLGAVAGIAGSLLGGKSAGLGGIAGLAGGLLGGAKGGATDQLAKLSAAVTSVLGAGSSLSSQAKDVFKSRLLEGNPVAAVAKQFGLAEGAVDGLVQQGIAAVRDQFLKSV